MCCMPKVTQHSFVRYRQMDGYYRPLKHKMCFKCDECQTEMESGLYPHSYPQQGVVTQPTCKEEGYTTYTCSDCEYSYRDDKVDKLPHKLVPHPAQAPTCNEGGWNAYEECEDCDYSTYKALSIDPDAHEWSKTVTYEWSADNKECAATRVCTRNASHTEEAKAAVTSTRTESTCAVKGSVEYLASFSESWANPQTKKEALPIDPDNHELAPHAAQAPTCTEIGWDAYNTCSRCPYSTYNELSAPGHSYQSVVTKPTCTEGGYTTYTCSVCTDSYTANPTGKLYHWYAEWSPNGDGTSSAACRRTGCAHVGEAACQRFDFMVDGESLRFCAVCGGVENGERLEQIETASARIETGRHPKGELIARTDGRLLSLAFEYAGRVTSPTGQVRFTLPASLLKGMRLSLVSPDGAETAVPFEADDDEISITLDFTDAEIPVMLLRLLPEA